MILRFVKFYVLGVMVTVAGGSSLVYAQTDTTGTAVYVIQEGDTLYELAARLGMHADSLAELNRIEGGYLTAGEELRIPENKTSRSYRVRRGDTLFELSRRFSVSVEEIRSANDMSNSNLEADRTIVIPGQGVRQEGSIQKLNTDSITKGIALVYPEGFFNRMMASGQRYDPGRYCISHPSITIGSIVLVRALDSGRETFAEVTERSFNARPLIIDVSQAVAEQLSLDGEAGATVEIRLIDGTD